MSTARVALAVDGGASKTDVVVLDLPSGYVLGRARGPGCSHHQLGIEVAVQVLDETVSRALGSTARTPRDVAVAGCYLTAVDLEEETADLTAALARTEWARERLTVDNDVFALLRTGTDAADAAVVVCGTGINAAAVRADGARERVLSLGRVSGDWGGGSGLADAVLWHAARAEDGRGPETTLRQALLDWTGRDSVHDVSVDVHLGRLSVETWWDRIPDVFALASAGDRVARSLVERQGHEVALLAGALLGRLGLTTRRVPVVLGGGILASGDARLMAAVRRTLITLAPHAVPTVVQRSPVLGAALLTLRDAGVDDTALAEAARGLADE